MYMLGNQITTEMELGLATHTMAFIQEISSWYFCLLSTQQTNVARYFFHYYLTQFYYMLAVNSTLTENTFKPITFSIIYNLTLSIHTLPVSRLIQFSHKHNHTQTFLTLRIKDNLQVHFDEHTTRSERSFS